MNAYTTRGQARMELHDVSAVLRADGLPAGAALATLEWHRGYQADAEVARLLRQRNSVTLHASTLRVSPLRQRIGAALVHVGERLAGIPHSSAPLEIAPAASTLGTAS
jgi:hypothetical protein